MRYFEDKVEDERISVFLSGLWGCRYHEILAILVVSVLGVRSIQKN